MNLITPHVTYLQRISNRVGQTVQVFPTVICNMVAEYVADYRLALQPLIFASDGRITNPEVREMIRLALTSKECDPSIKSKILNNMMDYGFKSSNYRAALRAISVEMEGQIILDDTILEGVQFASWNLDGMSALRTVFREVSFVFGSMDGAKLDGATLERCEFKYIGMNKVTALNVIYTRVIFEGVDVEGMISNEPKLSRYYAVTNQSISATPLKNCNALFTTVSTDFPLKRTAAVSLPNVAPSSRCVIL